MPPSLARRLLAAGLGTARGAIARSDAIPDMLAQFIGAIAAGMAATLLFPPAR